MTKQIAKRNRYAARKGSSFMYFELTKTELVGYKTDFTTLTVPVHAMDVAYFLSKPLKLRGPAFAYLAKANGCRARKLDQPNLKRINKYKGATLKTRAGSSLKQITIMPDSTVYAETVRGRLITIVNVAANEILALARKPVSQRGKYFAALAKVNTTVYA